MAVIEQVPAWATAPVSVVLGRDPHAFDGIPDDLVRSPAGGPPVLAWFAVPTSWDLVPPERRPAPGSLTAVHPHQLRRWQDRYARAVVFSTSARLTLSRLVSVL